MAKLFFTLYLMVLASFFVFFLYVAGIETLGESIGDGSIIDEKISKGTFVLLNKSLDGLDQQQIDNKLKHYKTIFGEEFGLVEISTLDLDEDDIQQLNNGKIHSLEKDNPKKGLDEEEDDINIILAKRPNTSLVWHIHEDFSLNVSIVDSSLRVNVNVTGGKFSEGIMYLIQQQLVGYEQQEWSEILKNVEKYHGFPILIKSRQTLYKTLVSQDDVVPLINDNKVVNVSQGTNNATFVQLIPNSDQLLQIGPVEIPWVIRNAPQLFIVAFVLAFATTLLLWLWPLWSNLIRMKKAADEFGEGNYNARIPHKKLSPIKAITQAFNAMAEQTQRSIRSQKELTSAVSHELRTPVARMRFALEMLGVSSEETEKLRYVKAINEDIDELDLLLEELLTYARLDQGDHRITLTPGKLIPWISNSMEKLMPLAVDRSLDYKVEGIGASESTQFEPRLMSRVLDNLVQNALRYSKHVVNVTLTKDNNDYLLIVEDDGDGIPEDKREHIFDAFSRIDASRDRASGGFGLGLAIVDRIVKAHQGTVSIHISALGGARFEVRIPAKK